MMHSSIQFSGLPERFCTAIGRFPFFLGLFNLQLFHDGRLHKKPPAFKFFE